VHLDAGEAGAREIGLCAALREAEEPIRSKTPSRARRASARSRSV